MAHCGIGRNLPPSTFQFPFPEGEFGMAIYDCCENWSFPRPSPREAMRVVAEDGTSYIYSLWSEYHLEVLECIKGLTNSQLCLALMVHAMVDQYMWHFTITSTMNLSCQSKLFSNFVGQWYRSPPIQLTEKDVEDIEHENYF